MIARTKTVTCGDYGWCAEVYADNDGGSGYGENPMVGYWYGSRADCEALDPRTVELFPLRREESPDPFDLACERRWD